MRFSLGAQKYEARDGFIEPARAFVISAARKCQLQLPATCARAVLRSPISPPRRFSVVVLIFSGPRSVALVR